jgi:uroporphyrinogen decarboxylase
MDLVFIHDDIATERGLVFSPEWYRRRLFPLYERLLQPIKARPGMKTIFVSDGNYAPVADDLIALGFDGLVVNSGMELGPIARRLGPKGFVAGNVSTSILTLGSTEDVRNDVRRCLQDAAPAGGHFLHAGGDLPHNIPADNMKAYFDAAADLGRRFG